MQTVPDHLKPPLADLLLSLADDKLLLGHLNSDWTGLAPILEEDIAFSHLAQDEIAHAQAIYELAGRLTGRGPDQLAFGRTPPQFRSAAIVETPDEFDWAAALSRKLFCDRFDALRLDRLACSAWPPLRDLARRIADEERVHVEHTDGWVIRLGRGTSESNARMTRALTALAPLAPGLFEPVENQEQLAAAGLYPGDENAMFQSWLAGVQDVLSRAGLKASIPAREPSVRGGRRGVHTPHLKGILDEMSEVYRLEPDAAW